MEYITEEKTILLDSAPESINRVTSYIDTIYLSIEKEKMNGVYGNIIIALTEAVNNAILHGNKKDRDKKVKLEWTKDEDNISFIVEDEGEGFDYENIPDPTSPENLNKLHGRGVFLMKNLVDNITFHNKGNKVELTFKLN